jgi:predicted MFS family arabinose efflux permease
MSAHVSESGRCGRCAAGMMTGSFDNDTTMTTALPRSFAPLTGANLAAHSAEQISLAAAPIVAVLMLNAGPGEIGLLAMVQTLPFLLLSIPLGLLADRMPRRSLMLWAEGLRAAALLALFAVVAADRLSITLLALLGFAGAVGTVGFSVAAPALVPSLVPREALARANGRLELARSAAFAAGPALAGALVTWVGASASFALATVVSVAAIALLLRLVEPPPVLAAPRHPLVDLREGARLVWFDPLLRPILLTAVVWNLAWFVLQAAYVPYAVRQLGLGAGAVGATLAANGIGLVVGALLAGRLVARLPFGRAIQFGPALSVLGALLMVATLVVPHGGLAALALFVFGVGPIVWTITSTTLRQTLTPSPMLGRVSAIFLTVNAGARPVGAALGAAVGAGWGEAACLLLALAGFVVQAWLIFASPIRALRQLPAAARA